MSKTEENINNRLQLLKKKKNQNYEYYKIGKTNMRIYFDKYIMYI